jgi:hypothetical protein
MKKSSLAAALLAGAGVLVAAASASANKERIRPLGRDAAAVVDKTRAALDAGDATLLAQVVAPQFTLADETLAAAAAIARFKASPPRALADISLAIGSCVADGANVVVCPGPPKVLTSPQLRFERRAGRWWWTRWTP